MELVGHMRPKNTPKPFYWLKFKHIAGPTTLNYSEFVFQKVDFSRSF